MNELETNAIEEAVVLSDFTLCNKLEEKSIEKMLPVRIDGEGWRLRRLQYAAPLFNTTEKKCGRLIGIILQKGIKCYECDGEGRSKCDECGHEIECDCCEGDGYTDIYFKELTLEKFYSMIEDKLKCLTGTVLQP